MSLNPKTPVTSEQASKAVSHQASSHEKLNPTDMDCIDEKYDLRLRADSNEQLRIVMFSDTPKDGSHQIEKKSQNLPLSPSDSKIPEK